MNQEVTEQQSQIQALIDNIETVVVGKRETIELTIVALLAKGHVLLEDVPGVGKTMLVRAIAKSLDLDFRRIQFTPDLLPSDVTGVSIYNQRDMQFEFQPGPIMGNVVLADEINRTSPKTQSALLESMEENHITVDGMTRDLSSPFFVLATQNPIEYEGTYPLPEAQLDRFLLKLKMGYPVKQEEIMMLDRTTHEHPIETVQPVMTQSELLAKQEEVQGIHVSQSVKQYIVEIVANTRKYPLIQLGASPRASIALMKAAQAYALVQGRDYVIPDDVKYMAPHVLAHRLQLTAEAKFEGKSDKELLEDLIKKTMIPVERG
ncbi:AAA family ATPase [Alkalibacillus almallahensis]|uniref:AAA family ATPase n=1 Tax=Alkalibacillus almallahensis TaxID=1379154 RepID=UPI001421CE43|nr:MoxR family ATPase [Alkalibacillus almallahensis]NIK11707.1 MoxR-like ATPase [Alkalibacillus almallahensis]